MRHFKLPLIATGITLALALVIGLAGVTLIHRSNISNARKEYRAKNLGMAVGFASLFVFFPFWILAAGKVGKERRAAREAQRRAQIEEGSDQ